MLKLQPLYILIIAYAVSACSGNDKPTAAKEGEGEHLLPEQGLSIEAIGKTYRPDFANVAAYQNKADTGGSTSVRNNSESRLEWKKQGYFQRNRDLGQVFTPEKDIWLSAIVLRTGPTDKAMLSGTPGAKVYIQFFEVSGTPRINDNGTPTGTEAKHGFSKNHRCDDYIEGVDYLPIKVVKGGMFPDIPSTFEEGHPVNGDSGKLVYMRWRLTGEPMKFLAGNRYAFIVGFEEPGKGLGFTLANFNAAGIAAPPALDDSHDLYKGGWGLRREGDGTLPPTMLPGENPPAEINKLTGFIRESLFATGDDRYALAPTTNGYPDVDTYRDLDFALEMQVGR